MPHLTSIRIRPAGSDSEGFPFDLPALATLGERSIKAPVTIFVGENGSGKSTLLEAIAIASKAITAGSSEAADDPSLDGVRALARALQLSWSRRTHRGFFLRAEDFFGFAKRVGQLRTELERGLAAVDAEYEGREGLARELARTPFLRELDALERRYGDGLDAQSHGESFVRFFQARLVPGGLYLLDEPEAPLSPARQLGFLALLRQMVADDCQVIMATHSPILMAFPGAEIWSFDRTPIATVAYEALEHVTLTRDFLTNPEAFLRHL